MPVPVVLRNQPDSMATPSGTAMATSKVLLVYSRVEWAALRAKMSLFKVRPVYIVTTSKSEFLMRNVNVCGNVNSNNK